ncbi:MAG: hypothetical protein EBS53_13115 [Bacteroidetes bacterium]|nr:hypothetical protein [Bacteroidota bacterium]
MKNFRLASVCVFLFGLYCARSGLAQAEILVYQSSVNRWSSTLIQDGNKSSWVTAPRGSKLDTYFLYDLDGTNKILPSPPMTYRNQTLIPYLIWVDHKGKTKQLKGGSQANEENNTEQTFYGRARGPKGQRIFRILYQQWEPAGDGSYDAGVSVAEGACQILTVGGGYTGYYAPTLASQGWRMDGLFQGPVNPYQDARQLKYLLASNTLDLPLTQAINNQSLSISQAFAYAIQNLFPSYQELAPDVR